MCGRTRQDRIRNEDIRDNVQVTSIVGKMKEAKLG